MSVSQFAQFDPKNECKIGPHKNVFMLTVRGLFSDWMVTFFYRFDYAIDEHMYKEIISKLYELNFIVKITLCDQGPKNMALLKNLNVTPEHPYSLHPCNDQIKVYFSFDFVHVFKNFASHLRDDYCLLPSGNEFTVSVFEDLLNARGPSEFANAELFDEDDLNIEGE